jgi:hypothetical protein
LSNTAKLLEVSGFKKLSISVDTVETADKQPERGCGKLENLFVGPLVTATMGFPFCNLTVDCLETRLS